MRSVVSGSLFVVALASASLLGEEFNKPYSAPCTERESVFEFTEKLAVKVLGDDKFEITFAVKGNCDVTVGIVDGEGRVVRHMGSGVLGANAPPPFQKNSLKQILLWNGKDDLGEYVKDAGGLKVRVMLGLKPEFDKRLGGTSPKNLPGGIFGVVANETGVFVITYAYLTRFYVRKFDHDGNYVMSLMPPPANLPESKLEGMGHVEYEPGQRAIHFSGDINSTVSLSGNFLPSGGGMAMGMNSVRPVVVGDRLFYASQIAGENGGIWLLNYINGDGSTSLKGCQPRRMASQGHSLSLAVSPDGRQLYFTGYVDRSGFSIACNAVWRRELDGDKPAALFLGGNEPGSSEGKFNNTKGMDCDAQGRLFICDANNNRVQVFSPEGKFLMSISAERPRNVAIHRRTGAVYLMHTVRVEGRSVERLTKYRSLDDPTPVAHIDMPGGMALDSWTSKPRLWLWGGAVPNIEGRQSFGLTLWEEEGNTFKKISDFKEESKKEDGPNQIGWPGHIWDKVVCDPVREQVYVGRDVRYRFDLRTGERLESCNLKNVDDITFDKRGYMHCHFNPGFLQPGVGRLDPSRPGGGPGVGYPECPYDYGVEGKGRWLGILPARDQLGAKYFQDGVGVNMMGDVAEQCNIYYAPKMENEGLVFAMGGHGTNPSEGGPDSPVANHAQKIMEMQKRGEEVYFIRRQPGLPLLGGTIWTFDRNGELQQECAVSTFNLINGVQLDEEGKIYFVSNDHKSYGGKDFLNGRGGVFGAPPGGKAIRTPFTGSLMKSAGGRVRHLSPRAPTPLEEQPDRPPELTGSWVEGAEWIYAGASPIVSDGNCSCPTQRSHLDWYKRTFVPEAYRHSIGVLDTAGNLIMHIGRYGNFDSGNGSKSKIPVGGDNIAIAMNRFISGADDCLVFDDHGERLVVLKLNYHAEETVPIRIK